MSSPPQGTPDGKSPVTRAEQVDPDHLVLAEPDVLADEVGRCEPREDRARRQVAEQFGGGTGDERRLGDDQPVLIVLEQVADSTRDRLGGRLHPTEDQIGDERPQFAR